MKYVLVIALFGAGIFVGVCNAACYKTLPPGQKDPRGCVYQGDIKDYGSHWRTESCYNCDCFDDGSVMCCQAYGTPVEYNEEKCEKIWDQEACVYHVVRKDNPKKTCKYSMVG